MLSINVTTVKDDKQRYNTVGDYQVSKEDFHIVVSDLPNWKYEFLIAIHELIESALCKERKITGKMIDDFDFKFNEDRKDGDGSEPGDLPNAPYHKEHVFAEKIEKMVADELGVDWEEYGRLCEKLNKD